ncbi:MAG: DUF4842 domain-containing protein, partial [Ferrimonas sp.]
GRGLEIHLADHPPTEAADPSFFGLEQDRTVLGQSSYRNDHNLPWGFLIPQEWPHPKEYMDLLAVYPKFAEFCESDGQQQLLWYTQEHAIDQHLFSEE